MKEGSRLIAREREIQEAQRVLSQALDGHGSVLFIAGEAGSGKTAFLQEFARLSEAESPEITAVLGECSPHTKNSDAYLPFKHILQELACSQRQLVKPVGRATTMSALVIKDLYDLAPDLVGIFVPFGNLGVKTLEAILGHLGIKPQGPRATPGDIDQNRILEEFAKLLANLSKESGLILFMDDLHWADEASMSLLFYICRRLREHRVLFVCSFRPQDAANVKWGQGRTLTGVVNELRRHGGHLINLDWSPNTAEGRSLSERFVREYLTQSFPGNQLSPAFVEALRDRTGGNPLFVTELLENMRERGELVQTATGWGVAREAETLKGLPEKVEAVVQERIGRLTEDMKRIMVQASVEGEQFTAQVLGNLLGLDEDRLLANLIDELGRVHQLVDEHGEHLTEKDTILSLFRFRHRLLQEHLYLTLGESQRRLAHKKVGETLETLYGTDCEGVASHLARHFELAHDFGKASRYLAITARQNARAFAIPEAIRAYERALELGGKVSTREKMAEEEGLRHRVALLRQVGDLYEFVGNTARAEAVHREGLSIAERLDDSREQAMALDNLGDVHFLRNEYKAAEAYYLRSEAISAERAETDLLAEVYVDLAELYDAMRAKCLGDGDTVGAQAFREKGDPYTQRAIEVAEQCRIYDVLIRAYRCRSMAYRRCGEFEGALHWGQKALEVAEAHEQDREDLNTIGDLFRLSGKLEQAREYYAKYLGWGEKTGSARKHVVALKNLGVVCLEEGHLEEANKYFAESLAANQLAGHVDCAVQVHLMRGISLFREGHIEEGIGAVREAMQMHGGLAPQEHPKELLTSAARILQSSGESARAEEYLSMVNSGAWGTP